MGAGSFKRQFFLEPERRGYLPVPYHRSLRHSKVWETLTILAHILSTLHESFPMRRNFHGGGTDCGVSVLKILEFH